MSQYFLIILHQYAIILNKQMKKLKKHEFVRLNNFDYHKAIKIIKTSRHTQISIKCMMKI